jgi:hypothetical protein
MSLEKLTEDLEKLVASKIVVGVFGDKARAQHPSGALVADVAAWMEFGTDSVPARPFIRTGMELAKRDAADRVATVLRDGLARRTLKPSDAMELLRVQVLRAFLENFDRANLWAVPLAESTVKRKGHAQPLVETQTLRNAIDAEVRRA